MDGHDDIKTRWYIYFLQWWRISAHRSPISPVGSIYVRPDATRSMFHVTVARSSAVGPSLLRVRWPGTHCQTASAIRRCQPALSDVISEDSSLLLLLAHQRTRGVYALYKSTTDIDIDNASDSFPRFWRFINLFVCMHVCMWCSIRATETRPRPKPM